MKFEVFIAAEINTIIVINAMMLIEYLYWIPEFGPAIDLAKVSLN